MLDPPDPINCVTELVQVQDGVTNDKGQFRAKLTSTGAYVVFIPKNDENSHASYSSHVINLEKDCNWIGHVAELHPSVCRMNISVGPNKAQLNSNARKHVHIVSLLHLSSMKRYVVRVASGVDGGKDIFLPNGMYVSEVDAGILKVSPSAPKVKLGELAHTDTSQCHW
jgi:hypothetical protein